MTEKQTIAILPLDDDNEMIEVLKQLSSEQRDKINHLLFVVNMEESHCPKKQRDYFSEFTDIYLGDIDVSGGVVDLVNSEIEDLTGRGDSGSIERLFYLKRWLNKKFGQ